MYMCVCGGVVQRLSSMLLCCSVRSMFILLSGSDRFGVAVSSVVVAFGGADGGTWCCCCWDVAWVVAAFSCVCLYGGS